MAAVLPCQGVPVWGPGLRPQHGGHAATSRSVGLESGVYCCTSQNGFRVRGGTSQNGARFNKVISKLNHCWLCWMFVFFPFKATKTQQHVPINSLPVCALIEIKYRYGLLLTCALKFTHETVVTHHSRRLHIPMKWINNAEIKCLVWQMQLGMSPVKHDKLSFTIGYHHHWQFWR